MKLTDVRNTFVILFALIFMFLGCRDTLTEKELKSERAEVEMVFNLNTDNTGLQVRSVLNKNHLDFYFEEETVLSRSGDYDIEEKEINDIMILQFSEEGVLICKKYITSNNINSDNSINVSLLTNDNNTIFFITNLGDSKAIPLIEDYGTIAEFKSLVRDYENESSVCPEGKIIMIGTSEIDVPSNSLSLEVELKRIIAKLSFDFSYKQDINGGFLSINSIQLKNVPVIGTYYDNSIELTNYYYPDNNLATNFVDYDRIEMTEDEIELKWYIPENRRGTKNEISEQENKYSLTAYDYSTFIELRGDYVPSGELESKRIVFSLYLGENTTNDFNIIRNTDYNIKLYLKEFDESDNRISFLDKFNVYSKYFFAHSTGYISGVEKLISIEYEGDILNNSIVPREEIDGYTINEKSITSNIQVSSDETLNVFEVYYERNTYQAIIFYYQDDMFTEIDQEIVYGLYEDNIVYDLYLHIPEGYSKATVVRPESASQYNSNKELNKVYIVYTK